jgi:ubiquinone/menaquinone biosynthesis C-methylase UbiE
VSFVCSSLSISREREKIVHEADGAVLEVGAGSGLNARFLDPRGVTRRIALEPSPAMRRRAAKRLKDAPFAVEWIDLKAENIPLDAGSIDSALVTFSLCTIEDPARARADVRRVLRPSGKLVFLEHGAAPDPCLRRTQDRLNGLWGRLAGGCRLNRDPMRLIEAAGSRIEIFDALYARAAPKFVSYKTNGVARPA